MALNNLLVMHMTTLTHIAYYTFRDSDNPFPVIDDVLETPEHANCSMPYLSSVPIPENLRNPIGWANFARIIDNWCWDMYQFRIRLKSGSLCMPYQSAGASVNAQHVLFRRKEDLLLFQLTWL